MVRKLLRECTLRKLTAVMSGETVSAVIPVWPRLSDNVCEIASTLAVRRG